MTTIATRTSDSVMRFLRPLAAAVVLCLVLLAVWVGQWRHFQDHGYAWRENRFTGKVDVFYVGEWRRMTPSAGADQVAATERKPPATPDTVSDLYREYLRSKATH